MDVVRGKSSQTIIIQSDTDEVGGIDFFKA
jgi:hypothetical protein